MIDLEALERLADAATAGPWVDHGSDVTSGHDLVARGLWLSDSRYIAALSPSTVKALIARIRELEDAEWNREYSS